MPPAHYTGRMQRRFGTTRSRSCSAASDSNYNGDAYLGKSIDWVELLKSQRILMIAEAGAGKTHECKAQVKQLFDAGAPAFFLRLEEVAANGVRSCLSLEPAKKRFDSWRSSSSQMGYFFLDSVDELQLVHGDFRDALERLFHDLEGALGRATVLVTSRPVDIDRKAFADVLPVPCDVTDEARGETFVRVATESPKEKDADGAPSFREVVLLPLSDEEIVEFARGQRVDEPEKLMAAIRARHADDFARRPQDLIELCDGWRIHKEIRAHYEQINRHINVRLRSRNRRKEPAELSKDKARTGAQRLALGAILSRRLTIRHSVGADLEGSGDAPMIPDDLLTDFTPAEIQTLLQRPMFGEGGYGRVRFHHRSVLEFLAAKQIHDLIESGALAVSAAKRMLFSLSDEQELLPKPSMRPVAGWLALMRQDIYDAVLKVEPSTLLLHGDPESLTDDQCAQALHNYIEQHGAGQWRGLEIPMLQLERLAGKPLHKVILNAFSAGIENPEVRQILLQLITAGRYRQCADLAFSIANSMKGDIRERYEALLALIRLDDHRVDQLLDNAISLRSGWNDRSARWIAVHLYPEQLDETQLLTLLTGIQGAVGSHDYFSSSLAHVIEKATISLPRLEGLLPGLLSLTRGLVTVVKEESALGDKGGHLRASYLLRALCNRLLARGSNAPDLVEAAVLGFRTASHLSSDGDRKRELAVLLDAGAARLRRQVFDADYACVARLDRRHGANRMLGSLMFQGPLKYDRERDGPWVLAAMAEIGTDQTRRSVLLHLMVALDPADRSDEAIAAMQAAIADSPKLLAVLAEKLKPHEPTPEYLELLEQQRKRDERRKAKEASDRADWMAFWEDLACRPALALAPGRADNTIWNLAKVLRRRPRSNDRRRWDREFLERSFSGQVVDTLRRRLMTYWRSMTPTLPTERTEKNTYLVVWTIGLMGLYAEAEDPRWTRVLSVSDANLAVRYALVELNGLPDWLASVADAYPQVVEDILWGEVESELMGPGGDGNWHSMLLQSLCYGRREITRVLQRRLVNWLSGTGLALMSGTHSVVSVAKLDQVARVLLTHGDENTQLWLMELATRMAPAAGSGPFFRFWLPVLFRLHPTRGAKVLLNFLNGMPVEKDGFAVQALGTLFNDRRTEGSNEWISALDPETLLLLTRAFYRHVEESSDAEHEGVYTPGPRDHAQDGRRYLFNSLIKATGAAAYQAKLDLSADPLFAHAKDRIAAMAHEKLAEEADCSVVTMEALAKLFRGDELEPKTSTDMAHLLRDRLDDLQDLMGRDKSPRNAWAQVSDENSLRAAIAHVFDTMAKGAYTVDQEGVTIEGKEMDIRFQSLSKFQACIELKIGEKPRSAKDLRDTIENQLVKKYMFSSDAKTGCLLVTVADANKTWRHPDTGESLNWRQLQEILEAAAQLAQQRLGGDARVMARVLDLTPRLPKEPRHLKGRSSTSVKPIGKSGGAVKQRRRATAVSKSGR